MNCRGSDVRHSHTLIILCRMSTALDHLARPLHVPHRDCPAASASSPTRGSAIRSARRPREAEALDAGRPDPASRTATAITPATSSPSRARPARRSSALRARALPAAARACRTCATWASAARSDVAGVTITMTAGGAHRARIVEDGAIVYLGGAAGFVVRAPEHADDLLRRRHGALRRHEDHRRDLHSRRSRSCRSAITTRWDPTPRRSPRGGSACARSCRCTGARFRC